MANVDHGEDPSIESVDAHIGQGYIGEEKAAKVATFAPGSPEGLLGWLHDMAGTGDWRRFERFAGIAVHLHPEGLAAVLSSVLDSGARGVNTEDLVDMLGELRAPEAVESLSRLLREKRESDAPFFALCVKCVQALGEIGTPLAQEVLRDVVASSWPDPLRWHAAVELGIEDELGFDEAEMLGGLITGYSSDFVVDSAFPVVMKRFVLLQSRRWDGLFLYGDPVDVEALARWELPGPDDDGYSGIVTFSAGQDMEDFWEENGYSLNSQGEGPYSVFYRLREQPLRARRVTGVHSADDEDAAAAEGTGLLLSTHFTISVVTPADPLTDSFSGAVLNDFLTAFDAAGKPPE